MSDIEELCATCKCEKGKCKSTLIKCEGNCTTCKCLNYIKDESKIHPYKDIHYKVRSNN